MEELRTVLRETQDNLTGYLSAKNSESLREFTNSTLLSNMAHKLNKENKNDDVFLLEKDLACLVESYLASAEGAVQAKRGRDVTKYVSLYEEARRGHLHRIFEYENGYYLFGPVINWIFFV